MTKNAPKSGVSARSGNAPAPYTKKNKAPYDYGPMYRAIQEHEPDSEFDRHLRLRRSGAVT